MRSFGSRDDTSVADEPLYAHYLATLPPSQQAKHPAADGILASQPTDWREVVTQLLGPIPSGKPIWYQKHMAHHLTAGMDLRWVESTANAILIRRPSEVIVSFAKVIPDPSPDELGFPQQLALLDHLDRLGKPVVIIDSRTILQAPEPALRALCGALGIPFDECMLSWQPGPRATDGVWAPHWYANVEASTAFAPYVPRSEPVPTSLEPVLDVCQPMYDRLAERAITVPPQ